MPPALDHLPPHIAGADHLIHAVVETPKGSRNKLAFEPELGAFKLKSVLPEGHSFPYGFGFVPSTKAADGDPLDVLLLLDAPTFPGCVVEARLIGAIELEQRETDGTVVRNDRLLAVADGARLYKDVLAITDLGAELLHEIEHFFHSYNEAKGGEIKVLRRVGPKQAQQLINKAIRAATPDAA
jgi:inorganic pyrophosphatase